MYLSSVLSGSLFMLPVLVTTGVYIGFKHQQVIDVLHGKTPPSGSLGSDGRPKVMTTKQYCDKFNGIIPYPNRYTLNPNQWGDPDNTGFVCMNVTHNPSVKQSDLYAANWTATWNFPPAGGSQPVHAYPNAMLNAQNLPLQLSGMKSLVLDVQWSYGVGNEIPTTTDSSAIEQANMNANVALDMFLSNDKAKAGNASVASYEVMVWLGRYGAATQPLGFSETPSDTKTINGTTFNLFFGANALNQQVFTWLAASPTTDFAGDISPLLSSLSSVAAGPQGEAYLGYMAFGTEAFYSTTNMTISVQRLKLDLNKS